MAARKDFISFSKAARSRLQDFRDKHPDSRVTAIVHDMFEHLSRKHGIDFERPRLREYSEGIPRGYLPNEGADGILVDLVNGGWHSSKRQALNEELMKYLDAQLDAPKALGAGLFRVEVVITHEDFHISVPIKALLALREHMRRLERLHKQ